VTVLQRIGLRTTDVICEAPSRFAPVIFYQVDILYPTHSPAKAPAPLSSSPE
jgi:hypothetical protein